MHYPCLAGLFARLDFQEWDIFFGVIIYEEIMKTRGYGVADISGERIGAHDNMGGFNA